MIYVYSIKIGGVIRYIGVTDNITRREKEHIRGAKKGQGKYLYVRIKENAPEEIISLSIVNQFNNKGDAKRYEALLILQDFFGEKKLWQSFPISIKYF